MKNKMIRTLTVLCMISFVSCAQENISVESIDKDTKAATPTQKVKKTTPHRYGGWYCPDNLIGFPAVDIAQWESVPVINGRLATKEETQTEASLIFVDLNKYPNAKPLDMKMPRLAKVFNRHAQREDIIIVIQALNISNDSIVGYRFLNGGNGSAKLSEVQFLTNEEINAIPNSRFYTKSIHIKSTPKKVWNVLTSPDYETALQPVFVTKKTDRVSNVNFHYLNSGNPTATYGDILYGNHYIQNDYDKNDYNEKFLLLENETTKMTELKIVCGPFQSDFEAQQEILNRWSTRVKELSEEIH